MMTEVERRARLITWLSSIYEDVQDLLVDDHIFWALQNVVVANPAFKNSSGLFTQWMASSFVQATAAGVRRQAKSDENSISLKRFLIEVQNYPSLVSRSHYMSLYAGQEAWLVEIGEHDFDGVAGAGTTAVPVALV